MPFHGIKSFRGLLADGVQDKIRLTTTDGRMGYRITKLQGITNDPGVATREHVLKIYKSEQSTIDGGVDFSDGDLLGCLYVTNRSDSLLSGDNSIIFDNIIFNQDIYITHFEAATSPGSGGSANFYIELEQIKLSPAQAEVLIVKDLRKQPWTRP